jgi:UDP-N-acetylmuramyl pentapeptide phosphotransferase/UDP-N-acetylglucosamine-1-phosphate transferase
MDIGVCTFRRDLYIVAEVNAANLTDGLDGLLPA